MFERLKFCVAHPCFALERLLSKTLYRWIVMHTRGIMAEGPIRVKGRPIINIAPGNHIRIGRNVTLRSSNEGHHANVYSPVKLVADRPGAEIVIGDRTIIVGTCVHAYSAIRIGRRCMIGAAQILDGSGHDLCFPHVERRQETRGGAQPIAIDDDAWIGMGVIILPGVTIGKGSVIGAGSVVTKDVPPYCVAAGNPARVIKDYSHTLQEADVTSPSPENDAE